jgi:polar amino acid transport system substrate-binding protein
LTTMALPIVSCAMRKFALYCTCVTVALAFVAGCAKDSGDSASGAIRDLKEVRQSGVLKWGSDEAGGAPYEFRDPSNPSQRVGFEVEIMDEIAKRMKVKIEFVQNDWGTLIPALNRGDFDVAMAGIEVTDDRKDVVLFSKPYYIYTQQLVVRADDKSINSLADCKGKKVGTLNNTAAERILKATPGVEIASYDDNVRPYEDCEIGRIDAVLLDLPIANHYAKPKAKLRFAGEPFGEGMYAICIRKECKAIKGAIDAALDEMKADGTLQKILEKWSLWNSAQSKL